MSAIHPTRPTVANIYNPQNQTKEQLIEGFVVRQQLFKKLFKAIKEAKMETPEQHYLILGRRGMGKTTLLLRLAYEIENDADLNGWLIPLVFNEEEYGIRGLFKFWERVMELLEEKHPAFRFETAEIRRLSKENSDHDAYEKALFEWLSSELTRHGKKLVLFVDNFGDMARKLGDAEAHRLRKILQTSADIRIFAASSVVLEAFYKYDHPFYEFFKQVELGGLNEKEARELLLALSRHYKKDEVQRIVEQNPGRVEALRRITGGVIRSVVLLFEIFADDHDGSAFHDLQIILDRTSPLYKHRMDDLSDQQQAIVEAIALNWDAISVKEIAEQTRLESKVVSAQLSNLEKNGIVEKRATRTKNHLYLIAERFFNIWFLMRLGRKADQKRVLWLVRFFEEWCDKELIKSRAERHVEALRRGRFDPESAFYVTQAMVEVKGLDHVSRHKLLEETKLYLLEVDTELAMSLSPSDLDLAWEAIQKWYAGEREESIHLLKSVRPFTGSKMDELLKQTPDFQSTDESVSQRWQEAMDDFACEVGWMYLNDLQNNQLARKCFEYPSKSDYIEALFGLGYLFQEENNLEKAIEWYEKAAEKGDSAAMNNLGAIYENVRYKDLGKAIEWFENAAKKGSIGALYNLGLLYSNEYNDPVIAEKWYKKSAINEDVIGMYGLSKFYFEQKKSKEKSYKLACKSFQKQKKVDKSWAPHIAHNYACILIWHNRFLESLEVASGFLWEKGIQEKESDDLLLFFTLLLAKNQTQTLYDIFTSPQGEEHQFKDRFKPIWYAILKKLDHPDFLRMGDELRQTVDEILAKAEQLAEEYK